MNVWAVFVAVILIAIPIVLYFVDKKQYFIISAAVITTFAITSLLAKGTFFAEVGAIVLGHIVALICSILFLMSIVQDDGEIDNFLVVLCISMYVIMFLMFSTAIHSDVMSENNTSPIIQETTMEENQYEFDDSSNASYMENDETIFV